MALRKSTSRYSTYLAKVADFYQKKEVKIYTNLILSLATASFFAFFAIKPTISTIAALTKEIKDQREIVAKFDQKIKDLSAAQKEYSRLKSKLHLIKTGLPETPELSLFLGQSEVIALENHLQFLTSQTGKVALKGKSKSAKQKETQEKSLHPSFKASLSLSGSYQEINNFLKSIANLRRMISIKKISIQKSKRFSPESSGLALKIDLEIFYLPTSEQL